MTPRIVMPPRFDAGALLTRDPAARVHDLAGATMGTHWSVRLAAAAPPPPALGIAIQRLLDDIVSAMSGWEPASDLSRFNRAAAGSWHDLPASLLDVLDTALSVARRTDGAFDPTIAALVDLWGFGPAAARMEPPDAAAIAAGIARSGWARLTLDRAARRCLQPGGLALDLSGIAKGYAVDRVAALLADAGCRHALVEIGGEVKGTGLRPDGQPWWVEVEPPPVLAGTPMRIALHGLAVATSGDYRRFFDHAGRRYAHSIDPRSGWPVANDLASVTVLHAECMLADAFATALLVMGPDDGILLAERNDLAALFVRGDGAETATRALDALSG